jgi:endogenous inhibitor of DNA gyrase (YacG/DUF329 family)
MAEVHGRCPICGKPSAPAFAPFCSQRCKDIDLNRWLSGVYVVPAKDEPEADDEASEVETNSGEDEDEA